MYLYLEGSMEDVTVLAAEQVHCDEPKDIEIDYDDTVETSSSSFYSLIKKCDVLLPNFTYEE